MFSRVGTRGIAAAIAGAVVIAFAVTSLSGAASEVSKASFVKIKCPGKTAKGKKVTCKVKGELPEGPEGPTGPQGPAGTDGVSGYETINQRFTDVFVPDSNPNRGLSAAQVVSCPAGKRAVGGGADLGTSASQAGAQRQASISASVPTPAGDGWSATVFNNSGFGIQIDVEVYVICARA